MLRLSLVFLTLFATITVRANAVSVRDNENNCCPIVDCDECFAGSMVCRVIGCDGYVTDNYTKTCSRLATGAGPANLDAQHPDLRPGTFSVHDALSDVH